MYAPKRDLFLVNLLEMVGTSYRYGAEPGLTEARPRAVDCSELVQNALARAGVRYVDTCPIKDYDGAARQWEHAFGIPVEKARNTPGSLMFIQDRRRTSAPPHISHVAVVIAPGYVVHASSSKGRVVIQPIWSGLNLAAQIRELGGE